MTFITDSRQPRGIGFLPLQHEFYQQQNWPLDQRACIMALRVTRRQLPSESPDHLGHYVFDEQTVGDLIGGMWWNIEPDSERPIPGWRFVWPSIVKPFDGVITGSGGTCLNLDPYEILPVWGHFWDPDTRFKPLDSTTANLTLTPRWNNGDLKWPKPARGMYGLALTADDEHQQLEYFYQTDPRMIAQHVFGDPKMGSMVCDLGEGNVAGDSFAVSQQRMARLHTFMRVIWGPAFTIMPLDPEMPVGDTVGELFPCDAFGNLDEFNSLAWQHMPHVCQHTGWGLVIDQKPKIPVTGGKIAQPGTSMRGIDSAFGAPYSIGMCSMYEGGFFAPAPDHDKHRVGIDGDNNKIFSQHLSTNALFRLPFDPIEPGTPVLDDGGEIILEQPTFDGPLHFELIPYPESPINPPFESQVILGWDETVPYQWNCNYPRWGKWRMWSFTGEGASTSHTRPVHVASAREYTQRLGYLWTPITRAHTAMMFRPISPEPGTLDFRHAVKADEWGEDRAALLDCFNRTSPMTMRVEAFGRMRQPSGLEFDYNIDPETARWPGGTAPGGIAFMPPELDILDADNDYDPDNGTFTPSTGYLVAVPRVYWAAGIPDFTTGAIRNGYRWGRTTTNGDLVWDRLDSSGTATETMRATLADGRIGIGVAAPQTTLDIRPSTSTTRAGVGGILHVNASSAAVVASASEQTLMTFTVPAFVLSSGRGIRVRGWGETAANATLKTIRLYFGATVVAMNDVTTTPNGDDWLVEGEVFFDAAGRQEAIGEARVSDILQTVTRTAPAENEAAAIIVRVTGEPGVGAAANDIVQEGFAVYFL